MSQATKHKALYALIPNFDCGNCGDCCGPVFCGAWEWQRMAGQRRPTAEDLETLRCPYRRDGQCETYTTRPLICRLFGATEDLHCPYGYRPTQLLTADEARNLMEQYHILIKEKP